MEEAARGGPGGRVVGPVEDPGDGISLAFQCVGLGELRADEKLLPDSSECCSAEKASSGMGERTLVDVELRHIEEQVHTHPDVPSRGSAGS